MAEVQFTEDGVKIYQTTVRAHARLAALEEGYKKFSCLEPCSKCGGNVWYASYGDCVVCTRTRDTKNRVSKSLRSNRGYQQETAKYQKGERFAELEMMIRVLVYKNGLMEFGLDVDSKQMEKYLNFAKDLIRETRVYKREQIALLLGPNPEGSWMDVARKKMVQRLQDLAQQELQKEQLQAQLLHAQLGAHAKQRQVEQQVEQQVEHAPPSRYFAGVQTHSGGAQ